MRQLLSSALICAGALGIFHCCDTGIYNGILILGILGVAIGIVVRATPNNQKSRQHGV